MNLQDHLSSLKLDNTFHIRIAQGNLYREQNSADHWCAMFVPIHVESNSVYMGDHIKAGRWIPPGGHMDLGEMPLETVIREMKEELDYDVTEEQVTYICASVKDLTTNYGCKRHWDLWHVVYMDTPVHFSFDTKEYHDAKWMSFDEALQLLETIPSFHTALQTILQEVT